MKHPKIDGRDRNILTWHRSGAYASLAGALIEFRLERLKLIREIKSIWKV